jgi:TonB family protein
MIAGDIPESADVGNTPLSETSDPTVRPDLENARDNADSANLAKPPFPTGNPGNWINSGDYPLTSLRIRRGGTVGFRLEIDQNGKVKDCTVTQSSGAVDLDAAACIKIFIRAKFEPARDAAGSATIGYWSSRIRWELPNAGFGALIPAGDETNDYRDPTGWHRPNDRPLHGRHCLDFPRLSEFG